jgi:hypothetical protein
MIFQLAVLAQSRTHLPYSIFGIGQLQTRGFVRNMGMGRSGIALASANFLNNLNPASYHSMDSISFFFDFGFSSDFVTYNTSNLTQRGKDANLKNIALGFRISRNWTSSFGIAPFSTVGYKIITENYVEGTLDKLEAELTGSGGLNQFYWDNCYEFFDRLSLGVNLTYLFGNIESSEKLHYEAFNQEVYSKQIAYFNKIYADFGIQYYFPLNDKIQITIGGVFGKKHHLNFKERINIYDSDGTISEDKITRRGTFVFPMYLGVGAALTYKDKFTVSADYLYYNWSASSADKSSFQYHNANIFRIGAEWIPGRLNQYGYLGRIRYRAGYYHEDSNLKINDKIIADDGFTLGLGLPFMQNKTSVNLAYNYGIRGTTDNGLFRENYHSVTLSLTLHDWWFMKRKFD